MSDIPGAKARLAASRLALMRELQPRGKRGAVDRPSPGMPAEATGAAALPDSAPRVSGAAFERDANGMWATTKRAAQAWWEFHPARTVAAIARPVMEDYAQHSPWKLMGMAAGLGALVVLTRPWKLISVGGLAVAALKSSQFSNLALSLLASRNANPNPTKDHE